MHASRSFMLSFRMASPSSSHYKAIGNRGIKHHPLSIGCRKTQLEIQNMSCAKAFGNAKQ